MDVVSKYVMRITSLFVAFASAAAGRGADKVGWDALSKNISIIITISIPPTIMDPQQAPRALVQRMIR